jgi:hypothetical protein
MATQKSLQGIALKKTVTNLARMMDICFSNILTIQKLNMKCVYDSLLVNQLIISPILNGISLFKEHGNSNSETNP